MYCEHCGEKTPDYSRFCEQCGKPVTPHQGQKYPVPAPALQSARTFPFFSKKISTPDASREYSRIALWIKERYGVHLTPGMDANHVRGQLEAIIASEQARRGIPQNALKGFRAFIDQQHYGMFIRQQR